MEIVALNLIRRDGGTQSRAALDETAISEYAEKMADGVEFPAMVVFYDGETYWMADGFHRAAAYQLAGIESAPCDIRQGSRRDAILHSVGANDQHGIRRSNADKRRAVETLLRDEEWRRWSNAEIARRCGVSDMLVADVRRGQDQESGTCERSVTGADGKQYPARRQRPDEGAVAQENRDVAAEWDCTTGDGLDDEPDDLPPAVDEAIRPEPAPASERRTVAAPPPETHDDDGAEPSAELQSVADAWNEMDEDEQDEFLSAVGAVRFSTLEALADERYANDEYHAFRRRERSIAEKFDQSLPQKMIAFVLDGGELALARLGLTWSSTEAEAKRAFKQASLVAHPDRGGSNEEFTAISRANAIVMQWLQGKAA